jgi:restriction system protein
MRRVDVLVLVAVAVGVGFAVLALAGARRPPPGYPVDGGAAEEGARGAAAPGLAWLAAHGEAGLERLLLALFAELGFEPGPAARRGGAVEFEAVDPAPIKGGRVRVLGLPAGEEVDADSVRALLDAARADGAGKAVLVTPGRFAEEARAAARDAPIDLVDGEALAALVRKHLPQAWATRTI